MRLLLKIVAGGAALVAVGLGLFAADAMLNGRRVFYAMLGLDGIVAACTPVLLRDLQAAGFQPGDVLFGATPDIAVSNVLGKSLDDTFTFQDGVAQTRVDGVMACLVRDGAAMVTFRTSASPVRAT